MTPGQKTLVTWAVALVLLYLSLPIILKTGFAMFILACLFVGN